MLDSLGSIRSFNFAEVRSFVYEFMNSLKLGPDDNQVGIISFSSTAHVDVYLNSYSTRQGYVIGVTSNVNLQELNAIASKPEYVSTINSFGSSLLQGIQEQQTYELCNRGMPN